MLLVKTINKYKNANGSINKTDETIYGGGGNDNIKGGSMAMI